MIREFNNYCRSADAKYAKHKNAAVFAEDCQDYLDVNVNVLLARRNI